MKYLGSSAYSVLFNMCVVLACIKYFRCIVSESVGGVNYVVFLVCPSIVWCLIWHRLSTGLSGISVFASCVVVGV